MPTARNGYAFSDGAKAHSVTNVLESLGWGKEGLMYWAWDLGCKGFAYKDLRKQAATIGTIAHERVECDLLGKPWEPQADYDPQDIVASDEPFEKYLEWKKQWEIVVVLAEKNLVSDHLGYAGTPDFLVKMRKRRDWTGGAGDGGDMGDLDPHIEPWRLVLIDLKTSKAVYPSMIVQVAAYAELIEDAERDLVIANSADGRIDACLILRVGKDVGEFESLVIPEGDLDEALGVFHNLLPIHQQKAYFDKTYSTKKSKKVKAVAEEAEAPE